MINKDVHSSEESETAETNITESFEEEIENLPLNSSDKTTKKKKKKLKEHKEAKGNRLISKLLDVKLFGGMVPEEARVVGCFQCDWATSLHPIKVETMKVSSAFSSTEDKTTGSLGRRYIIPYGIYGGSFIYSYKRNESFKKMTGEGLSLEDMSLFEEALKNGCMDGRTGIKGFIEPIMILKVVKNKEVGSRYDDLLAEVSAEVLRNPIVSSQDIELDVSRLKKVLEESTRNEFTRIELFVSKSGERKHKALKRLKKKYPSDLSVREGDLEVGIEYVILYEVKRSNPNGDPEMDNMPRRWEGTDIGIISPERQKRWIRDYIESLGHLIFISRSTQTQKAKERLRELEDII